MMKATFKYTKSPGKPDHLYVFETNEVEAAELALLTSLQGLTAKTKPQIYIIPNSYDSYRKFLMHMNKNYNISYTKTNDVWALVEKFRDAYEGYILYDMPTDSTREGHPDISINVATSLCGVKRALLIAKSLEAKAQSLGIQKIADVSGKNYEWLVEQPEYSQFAKNVMIELPPSYHFVSKLRDYAIMCNAICFYQPEDPHTQTRAKILADMEPDTPVIGWGSGNKGEDKFIDPSSEAGHYYVPADHAFNITVLSSLEPEKPFRQKNHQTAPQKPEKGKHYVTLVMSDGDNLQYALTGLEGRNKLYDCDLRGKTSISWGIPSSIVDLGTIALDDLYNRASDGSTEDKPGKDYFVTYCCGGYMYPSRYPSHLMEKHAEKLSEAMKKADARILGVIDFDQYNYDCLDMWDNFTKQDGVDACFYVDYCSYHTDTDQMLWSNDKPVIASKARFWEGLPNSDIEYISKKINSAPTDPSDPNTYSLIMVHCWSKFVPDVVELVKSFAPHVEVITTETFVQMIKDNVDRTRNNGIGVKAFNTTYLYAPVDLGNYQYPCDESGSRNVSINHSSEFEYIGVANSIAGKRYGTKVTYSAPGATYKKKFLDGLDIFIGTKFELGIFSEDETPKKIEISFYNSEKYGLFNFVKELTIDYKGWKFFSVNIPFDLVGTDYFEIRSKDNGGYSLTFSEMTLRYKDGKKAPGILTANSDMLELNPNVSFDLSFGFSDADVEEFSLSGAIYYTVKEKPLDLQPKVSMRSADESIAIVTGKKVIGLKSGQTTLTFEAVVDGQKYLKTIPVIVK